MSLTKESILLVVLANLVLSIVVVAGAMMIFRQDEAEGDDESRLALEARLSELEQAKTAAVEPDPGQLNLTSELRSLAEGQRKLLERLEELEKSPRAVAGSGAVDPGGTDPNATAKPANAMDGMMKLAGRMWADRLKSERDRYIKALMDPTPESDARQERMMRGLARRSARNLGLSDQESKQLEDVLIEVDEMRRDQFRDLITNSGGAENVKYEDVDRILKDSYAEEDRRVSQTLPREKSDQYKSEAEPIRGMMDGMAKSMFPEQGENK